MRPRLRRPRHALLLAAVLPAAACHDSETVGPVCTRIGCTSGFAVRFDGGPAAVPYRLEVTTSGGRDVVHLAECPDPTRCGTGRAFPDLVPDQVSVTVVTAGGRASYDRVVQYEVSYPNGRRCGPECRQGTVSVPRPER